MADRIRNEQDATEFWFELRDGNGDTMDTDHLTDITLAEAKAYAKKWMKEMVGTEAKAIAIYIDMEYGTIAEQSDFGAFAEVEAEAKFMADWKAEWAKL